MRVRVHVHVRVRVFVWVLKNNFYLQIYFHSFQNGLLAQMHLKYILILLLLRVIFGLLTLVPNYTYF